jgi:nicotinamidase/pyrazinamidase
VAGTPGAEFHPELTVPVGTIIVSKGTRPDEDAYSAFQAHDEQGTALADALRRIDVQEVYIGGLATDYCVRASALDALKEGFRVALLEDAVRGVDVNPGDSDRALEEMLGAGARKTTLAQLDRDLQLGD